MAPADISEMGLADLSAHIGARELSSAEAVSSALTRLDRLEGKLNAFITVLSEQAPAEAKGVKGNGDDARHASYNHSNLLRLPNMLGLPGCSLPCGMSPEGLPIGMQLIGEGFANQTVLNAAAAFQSATDWHQRRPDIAKV